MRSLGTARVEKGLVGRKRRTVAKASKGAQIGREEIGNGSYHTRKDLALPLCCERPAHPAIAQNERLARGSSQRAATVGATQGTPPTTGYSGSYFQQEPLCSLTVKRITDYRTWRADQGVGLATLNAELGILRRVLKRAKLWARVADDIRPLKDPNTIGRALTYEEQERLLKTASMRPEWRTAYLAALLCLNTTARGCG
jgi:hypothetical protein